MDILNGDICKNSFHNTYLTDTSFQIDGHFDSCPKCGKDFLYINKDGTIDYELYNNGLLKSIRFFQRHRTEWYRK